MLNSLIWEKKKSPQQKGSKKTWSTRIQLTAWILRRRRTFQGASLVAIQHHVVCFMVGPLRGWRSCRIIEQCGLEATLKSHLVRAPSLCSQPHGSHGSVGSTRELKGQDPATDSLWASHAACPSYPFLLLCSSSRLSASWGFEMFARGQRKAAGGMETLILQRLCCVYRVMFVKQYQPK